MIPVAVAGCRGWLHPGTSARGVVLCGATGFEGFKTYRGWYQLAGRIAALGPTVLRFDYPGTGESLGDDAEPGRIEAWRASIEAAIDWLKGEAGATDIHLAGLRLGATLAAQVAERRSDVAGLALLAPVAGRTLAREVALQAEMFNQDVRPPAGTKAVEGGVEVAGFFHGEALLGDLRALSLREVRRAPPRVCLVMPAGGGPGLREHFEGLGSRIAVQPFANVEAVLENDVLRPEPVFPLGAAGWLAEGCPARPPRAVPDGEAPLHGPGWTETVLRCGPGRGLVGTLCLPTAAGAEPPPVLVTVTGGRNPRQGWARSSVETARALAPQGIATLRLDAAGIGDSADDPARPQPIYAAGHVDDLRAAVDALHARGLTRIAVTGVCSGSNAVLHAAAADPRIRGVALVNLQAFFWAPGLSMAAAVRRRPPRRLSDYAGRLLLRRSLVKIARGQMPVLAIARRIARHQADGLALRARGLLSGLLGIPSPTRDVRGLFARLLGRGTRVLLLYSDADPGLDEVARHLGRGARWLVRRGGRLEFLVGADHTVTPAWARGQMRRHLAAFLRETFPDRTASGGPAPAAGSLPLVAALPAEPAPAE